MDAKLMSRMVPRGCLNKKSEVSVVSSPKISIAIPTRNRSHILKDTLAYCLNQTFRDFEIVISENSTDDSQSKSIVQSYKDDRIKYLRTGGLSMADNWEFALKNCSGELLYPIAEKILLHKDTLADIIECSKKYKKDIYSFCHAEKDDINGDREKPKWVSISTKILIDEALSGNINPYLKYGVRGYSLVISKKLFINMFERYKKVLIPFSPDFTLAFMATLHTDSFCYSDNSYFIYNPNSNSNGASGQYGGKLSHNFFLEYNKSKEETLSLVPIQIYTVWNTVLNDFFRVCNHINKRYSIDDINKINYWKNLYSEIVNICARYHIDKSEDFQKMFTYLEDNNLIMRKEILTHINNCRLVTLEEANFIREINIPRKNQVKVWLRTMLPNVFWGFIREVRNRICGHMSLRG